MGPEYDVLYDRCLRAEIEIASLKTERDRHIEAAANKELDWFAEKRRADLLEAKCAEMTRDLQSVFNGDGEAMRAILARAGKPLFGPATTAQLAFLSVGALLLLAASEGNPGQLLLDRLAEAERLVRSYQKELSDARAFGVSKSGRLEKLERALRMMLNYHSVSETHGPNYQHECLACNAAREALAACEPKDSTEL